MKRKKRRRPNPKPSRKASIFLVVYSHRFGNDYWACEKECRAEEIVKEIQEGDEFEPDRDETIAYEEVLLE
jgi:hypothetical protein